MTESDSPTEFFEKFLPSQMATKLLGVELAPGAVSAAAVVFRVKGAGQWSLSFRKGQLHVDSQPETNAASSVETNCALQLTVAVADFDSLLLGPARIAAAQTAVQFSPDSIARRLRRWDEETTGLIRSVQGSVLVKVNDAGTTRALAITPGHQSPSLTEAECTVDCALDDLRELQQGTTNPLGLLAEGKLRITGDAQIVMGLAGLFL